MTRSATFLCFFWLPTCPGLVFFVLFFFGKRGAFANHKGCQEVMRLQCFMFCIQLSYSGGSELFERFRIALALFSLSACLV